jgi:hypothetical protein
MNNHYTLPTTILLFLLMSFNMTLNAQEKHHGAQEKHSEAGEKRHGGMVHSDEVNHMHHQLENDQASFKAKEAQAQKELNEMTIREDVKIEDVNAKIDELMAAKTQIMRLRYDHLIKMRETLTDEQKIGYDKSVLKRTEIK